MITNITLENFKCFRHVSINPKRLTVLIGPNGTGKSGVLQAFTLLRQSRDASEALDLEGPLLHMPSEDFMFHGLDPERNRVGLSLAGYREVDSENVRSEVHFNVEFRYDTDAEARPFKDGSTKVTYRGSEISLPIAPSDEEELMVRVMSCILYCRGQGLDVIERPRAFVGHQPSLESSEPSLTNLLNEASTVPTMVVAGIKVVPLIRGLTQPVYALGQKVVEDISSVKGLSKLEEDTVTSLGYLQTYVSRVSSMLERVTGVGFKVNLTEPVSLMPHSYSAAVGQVGLVSEGFGTNGLIQLFFELARSEKGATVLIEEPEIHLHPKAQADLAEVMADTAKDEDKQIIMTTHSEYVAGRLLTLVAEGKLTTDELAIYSFEKDEKGECSATEIEVTERGQTKGGLTGFDEATRDEMRRYADGLRKHT